MPTYSFVCKECKKKFNLTMSVAEHDKGKFTCPKCKSKKVDQTFDAFFAMTAKKS